MSLTKTICFANNKGGSGKSTTCANVAYNMAMEGKRVLVIDGDMQLNLTLSFFTEDEALDFVESGNNLYTAVKEQRSLDEYIVKTPYEGLDIVPSSTLMSGMEYELFTKWQREFILRKCLEPVKATGVYDYILIDSPPTLGGWVMNIMCASDYVVVPVEASPWGLFGLANMFDFVEQVKEINPKLHVLGIAITKADERKNYFKQTVETLRGLEDIKLFETFIRIDSSIEWAQDMSKPVGAYKKSSRSAKEYSELAKEIMNNVSR
ncbi:MAG: ParA family protein [Clostridia bacterium]|nr:ParA family protein [Clostridia bacterium]